MSSSLDPIHGAFANPPAPLPLGVSISDRVSIASIDRRAARAIYQEHHSYLPRDRQGWHYGVYFDDEIVGAITFDCWPSQSTIRGYESADIREVARVCIGLDMANLASCATAKAQDRFVSEHGDGIELLVTYIREDYEGSMFKALRGKGWEYDGHSEGHAPGNRQKYDIHDYDKQRWVCEI